MRRSQPHLTSLGVVIPLTRATLKERLEIIVCPHLLLKHVLEVEFHITVIPQSVQFDVVPVSSQLREGRHQHFLRGDILEHLRIIHEDKINGRCFVNDATHHPQMRGRLESQIMPWKTFRLKTESSRKDGARHSNHVCAFRHAIWTQHNLGHLDRVVEKEIEIQAAILTHTGRGSRAQATHVVDFWQPPQRELCISEEIVELHFCI
mmetsp:Transcript_72022/g.131442  ORF Transcript_72022/g.131442 Transcript_72022/m.131442 type:complete len:206 (+) Transcript_72022:81-698(+)